MALARSNFRTPNRVAIRTGHSQFDAQCDIVSTGNVTANTQYSGFIRAVSETECNGMTFVPGHLFEYDMKGFRDSIPPDLEKWIWFLNQTVILYEFRHWSRKHGTSRKQVHGYVVTDADHNLLKIVVVGKQRNKSLQVLTSVLPYIAERDTADAAAL